MTKAVCVSAALACAGLMVSGGCRRSAGPPADLVLRGGRIVTMQPEQPEAEALAIVGDRIRAIGRAGDIEALIGPETRLVDLRGGIAIPAFIETHAHFLALGQSLKRVDLAGVTSFEDVLAKVKVAAGRTPSGTWLLGGGWDQNLWVTKEFPTRASLDAIAPATPIVLNRVDLHAAWTNGTAMDLAGITKATKDPPGGVIVRDRVGNPTGIFIDRAVDLVASHIPPPTVAERREAFGLAQMTALAAGVATVHDADALGAAEESIETFRDVLGSGGMKIRVSAMINGTRPALLDKYFAHPPEISPHLTIRSVKLQADGALGSRGAALLEDYNDQPGSRGTMIVSEDEIYRTAVRALAAGYQMNVHAIGDRANRDVLNAYERAFKEHPEVHDPRFRIEHAQILDAADIPRFGRLGVIAAMQGVHATSDMPWVATRLGDARVAESAYVWQKLLRSGARVINGTDTPVERISPLECYYASVTRQDKQGQPAGGWYPDQRMTRDQALRSYTIDAAYAGFEERDKGSLAPGRYADIAVLSKDIRTIDAAKILSTAVRCTIVGGKVEFEAPQER